MSVGPAQLLKRVCEMGLEGVVSKRRNSRYRSGRTSGWIRTTCRQRETLVITGYAIKDGRFDGLYLGRWDGNELVDAGKVDLGFTRDNLPDLRKRLDKRDQKTQAYTNKNRRRKAIWVKPDLLAEIEYRGKTEHGEFWHPVFKGLREDL
jgi:bifunctional non-homologous end joining protein LigD